MDGQMATKFPQRSEMTLCADIVAKVFSSWRMKILSAADAL
jgi:hypothetical protein